MAGDGLIPGSRSSGVGQQLDRACSQSSGSGTTQLAARRPRVRGREGGQSLLTDDHLQTAGGRTLCLPPRYPTAAAQPSEQGHLAADAQGLEGNLRSQEPAAQSQRLKLTNSQLTRFARPDQLHPTSRTPHGVAGRLPTTERSVQEGHWVPYTTCDPVMVNAAAAGTKTASPAVAVAAGKAFGHAYEFKVANPRACEVAAGKVRLAACRT